MPFTEYLQITARSLRDDVLPMLDDPTAKQAAGNCLHILASIIER